MSAQPNTPLGAVTISATVWPYRGEWRVAVRPPDGSVPRLESHPEADMACDAAADWVRIQLRHALEVDR